MVTDAVDVPTIGIGAGPGCDGQVLVFHDLLGLEDRKPAKFVRRYASLRDDAIAAVAAYADDVRTGQFPGPDESYHLSSDVAETLGLYGSHRRMTSRRLLMVGGFLVLGGAAVLVFVLVDRTDGPRNRAAGRRPSACATSGRWPCGSRTHRGRRGRDACSPARTERQRRARADGGHGSHLGRPRRHGVPVRATGTDRLLDAQHADAAVHRLLRPRGSLRVADRHDAVCRLSDLPVVPAGWRVLVRHRGATRRSAQVGYRSGIDARSSSTQSNVLRRRSKRDRLHTKFGVSGKLSYPLRMVDPTFTCDGG